MIVYYIPPVNLLGSGCLAELEGPLKKIGCKKVLLVNDPELMLSKPRPLTAATVKNGNDLQAREQMCYACFLNGIAFSNAGLGNVHAMAHQLGGLYNLPHGVCNAMLLSVVEEANAEAAPEKFRVIAETIGFDVLGKSDKECVDFVIDLIKKLAKEVGIPSSLTDENVERFYDRVADGINGDMYLYNYPDRTGYHVSSQATLNLLRRHKNIIGYKDSVSDFSHTRELLAMTGTEFPEFMVYSGFDENFVHNLMSGGCGCIGGLSNIYPEVCSAWVKSVNEYDVEKMANLQKLIDKMMVIYGIASPFMPVVRKALQMRGLKLTEYCTHPIGPVSEEQSVQIKAVLDEVDAYIAEAGL